MTRSRRYAEGSADGSTSSDHSYDITRVAYDAALQVEAVISDPKAYKKFVKRTKCAECGTKCMEKRFASSSALIVIAMVDTFWYRCVLQALALGAANEV